MIRCQHCALRYPDGTLFCDRCGNALDTDTPPGPLPASIASGQMLASNVSAPVDATPAMPLHIRATPLLSAHAATLMDDLIAGRVDSMPSLGAPRVRLRLSTGKTFELNGKQQYVIGRRDVPGDQPPDVDLADWNGAASGVSRRHAALTVTPEGVFVEDLESRNETIHNGYRLLPRQQYVLADGDELRLGTLLLLVVIG